MSKLLLLLVLIVLMGGCVQPVSPDITPQQSPKPMVEFRKGIIDYAPLPQPEESGIVMGPPVVVIGKIRAGDTIDTWVEDGLVPFRNNTIRYKKGDGLSLVIVNGNRREVTYRMEYRDAPDAINYSDTVGNKIGYQRAPPEARNWVAFPSSVLVPDGYAVKIPVAIVIPEKASIPQHWEFRIMASMMVSPTQEIGAGTRFLLSKG